MTTFQRLKHEARKAEQRSDWRKAIALYREAMRFDERQHGTSELGLFNRIGDLHIRLGEVPQAVECYEQAADRYAENDLPTSAIALCNKILRVAPDRTDVFRRLGLLHATTGLLAEARSSLLQFVDRTESAGDLSSAVEAVQEFVNLTQDETIRVQVAELLAERGHPDQAQAQLRLASDSSRGQGLDTEGLEQRIEQLGTTGPQEVVSESAEPATPPDERPSMEDSVGGDKQTETGTSNSGAEPPAKVQLGELVGAFVSELDPHAAGRELVEDSVSNSPDGEVGEALARFRARVQPDLDRSGPQLHYDLGVAFQTMGLKSAAVEELRRGIAAPGRLDAAHHRISEILEPNRPVDHAKPEEDTQPMVAKLKVGSEFRPEVAAEPAELEVAAEPAEPEVAAEPAELELTPDLTTPEPASFELEAVLVEAQAPEPLNPDLQGLLFRARLAQYQIRQAEDSGQTDHRSHLDLGAAYSDMGLRQEAIRELVAAAAGPTHVASRAVSMMLDIARDRSTAWELAISVVEQVRELDETGAAEPVLHELAGRWGEDHPGAGRVGDLLGWVVTAAPSPGEIEPDSEPDSGPEDLARAVEFTEDAPVVVDSSSLEVLDQLLDHLEDESTGGDEPESEDRSDPGLARRTAEQMVAEGRLTEAVSHLYRTLETLENARRIPETIAVVDYLLQLRPDDVVLHHQRAEFALTLDDRDLLVSSYMSLAACLRRQNAQGNARTVYARILDIDPGHVEAMEAFEQLSFLHGGQANGTIVPDSTPAPTESRIIDPGDGPPLVAEARAEFDALLDDLRDPGPAGDDLGDDAEAHFELGVAFKQMEMWDEALAELEKAVTGLQNPVRVWEVMAECLERADRKPEAIEILTTAEAYPGNQESPAPGVLYRLALLLEEVGDQAGAVQRLRRVVDLDASFRDAASRLSALSQ
jgi:tetratricopeptide (TPR) repeat protein